MGDDPRQTPLAACRRDAAGATAAAREPVVALTGAPNVGKTTLFNDLTGAHRETGNWPGTSVEVECGTWQLPGREVTLVDLPGAYSLDPLSPGEALTRTLLVEVPEAERPDLALIVIDATALARSLYLLAQLRERPGRMVAVVTMGDVAASRGIQVDADQLAEAAGMPVIALDPRRQNGADRLAAAVAETLDHPPLPALDHRRIAGPGRAGADDLPDQGSLHDHDREEGGSTQGVLDADDARFAWIDELVRASQERGEQRQLTRSDRIDRVVTSPGGGVAVFLAAMWLLFQTTTAVAAPIQRWLAGLLAGPVAGGLRWLLDEVGLGDGVAARFVVQGLLPGVGMLLTFVPLMALMFAALSVLEYSGYMARAAVVTDQLMRTLRLPGRAFLPLVVGFGCNVPAVLSTRVLPNARHRLLTALLVPFTSCSARLTVYVLVAGMFFPEHAGSVVFVMYLVSILFVALIGLGLRSTVLRYLTVEPLMIDLPPYHLPVPRLVWHSTWIRLRGFLATAGGLIVATVALVWLIQAAPLHDGDRFGEVPVERSLYASAARTISPAFTPAGLGDWHTSSALMTGFVAKEAVISTWAQTYAAQQPVPGPAVPGPAAPGTSAPGPAVDTDQASAVSPVTVNPQALGNDVRAHFTASSGGHPEAAAWAFLVFLLAYTPCVATLAAQKREIGLRWTAFGMASQLTTAWLVAVVVFQVGRLIT